MSEDITALEARIRATFERQAVMALIGAQLTAVQPGLVEITLPFRADLTQQHGFIHAGIVTAIVDTACGYAAFTLMPPERGVLSVEFKVNFLRPAQGARLVARGRALKPGRTLTVCTGEVLAVDDNGTEKLAAVMQATMMSVAGRPGVAG